MAWIGYLATAFSLASASSQAEQQRLGFDLETSLLSLSSEEESARRSYLGVERSFALEELGYSKGDIIGYEDVVTSTTNEVTTKDKQKYLLTGGYDPAGFLFGEKPSSETSTTYGRKPIYATEDKKGRIQTELESKFAAATGSLGGQEQMAELQIIESRISKGLEQNDLRAVVAETTKRTRLQVASLATQQGALGKSAALRGSMTSVLTATMQMSDKLAVSKKLGAIGEEQYGLVQEQFARTRTQLDEAFDLSMDRLESQRRQAGAKFGFEFERSQMREKAIAERQQTAEEQKEAGGLRGALSGLPKAKDLF